MLRIFLVEDSPIIRENLVETLRDLAGATVIGHAESENEAIHWLTNNPAAWDMAIVDLFLKQGSGLAVLKACRERNPAQKVVVLSNYAAAQEVKKECARLGADASFDKSNDIDNLIELCAQWKTQ